MTPNAASTSFRHRSPAISSPTRTIRCAIDRCSLGYILAALSPKGLCALTLGDDPDVLMDDLQRRFPHAAITDGAVTHGELAAIIASVEDPATPLALPLDQHGTPFQQAVWQALRTIPAGATATYAGIAERIGLPAAVRAVAQACGANPVAVIVPCHRVVRSDGALSGYRWGMERKRALLERERVQKTGIPPTHDA